MTFCETIKRDLKRLQFHFPIDYLKAISSLFFGTVSNKFCHICLSDGKEIFFTLPFTHLNLVKLKDEAALEGRPVEYRTEDGRGLYRADPVGPYDSRTRCSKIHERVWEDGRLVKDQIREVCEGTKYERRYYSERL